jgi:hypothetical protein
MNKILTALLLVAHPVWTCLASNGALENLRDLPLEFQNGVLKLSADNCEPDPERWYVAAKSTANEGAYRNIEMASGQILSNKPALGLFRSLGSNKPVSIYKIQFDSRDAFDLAQRYANANSKTIANASMALTQQGEDAAPIWSVWCYAPNGTYFGLMQFLATDGAVISNDAFPKKP